MAKTINLQTGHVLHKGAKRIKLVFKYDSELIAKVRDIPGARWSATMGCWHLPDNENSVQALNSLKSNTDAPVLLKKPNQAPKVLTGRYSKADKIPYGMHAKNIERFTQWLKGQRYSEKTIITYTDALSVFFRFYRDKEVETIDNKDIVRFNYEYILRHNYSASYQNQVINALKLFFRIIENKAIIEEEIERPRRPQKLPDVLSKEEVERILKVTTNLKHKAILVLIYSCGLRRGELLKITPESIASDRGLLIIKGGKGNKDRIAPLSEKVIELLRTYYNQFKPKTWLFEGQNEGVPYSESSIQEVFKTALKKSKIKKKATLHWLRHSYATHLLENGVDLRYIQEILGHKSSKTTEIYTHVTNKSIGKIKSPIEDLDI